MRPRKLTTLLAAVVAGLVMALLAAEMLLRAFDRPRTVRVGWRTFYGPYEPVEEANQLRFRGRPIEYDEGDYVVVLLGDSQVEAKACSYEWMPERRLEAYLRELTNKPVKVFSLGVSGYGQDQQLIALREYFASYRADHVIAWLTMTNDVKDNTWPTFVPIDGRPKPTFWLEDGELRGPNHEMGVLPRSKLRVVAQIERWAAGSPDARWERERLPAPYQPLREYDGPLRSEWQALRDKGLLVPAGLRREKSDRSLLFTPQSERTRYGITLTNKLLGAIRDESTSHGARFSLFGVDKSDRSEEIDGVYALGEDYYRVSSRQFWENVDQISAGFDFHLIDVDEPHWRAGPLNLHLNEHATDGVMRKLARRLAPEL